MEGEGGTKKDQAVTKDDCLIYPSNHTKKYLKLSITNMKLAMKIRAKRSNSS